MRHRATSDAALNAMSASASAADYAVPTALARCEGNASSCAEIIGALQPSVLHHAAAIAAQPRARCYDPPRVCPPTLGINLRCGWQGDCLDPAASANSKVQNYLVPTMLFWPVAVMYFGSLVNSMQVHAAMCNILPFHSWRTGC